MGRPPDQNLIKSILGGVPPFRLKEVGDSSVMGGGFLPLDKHSLVERSILSVSNRGELTVSPAAFERSSVMR